MKIAEPRKIYRPRNLVGSNIVGLDLALVVDRHFTTHATAILLHLFTGLLHFRTLQMTLLMLLRGFHKDTASTAESVAELCVSSVVPGAAIEIIRVRPLALTDARGFGLNLLCGVNMGHVEVVGGEVAGVAGHVATANGRPSALASNQGVLGTGCGTGKTLGGQGESEKAGSELHYGVYGYMAQGMQCKRGERIVGDIRRDTARELGLYIGFSGLHPRKLLLSQGQIRSRLRSKLR